MKFIYSYFTHNGTVKTVNQDSLLIEKGMADGRLFHLFMVCDGMGGLEKGEVASAELVHAFSDWFRTALPAIWRQQEAYRDGAVEVGLKQLLDRENRRLAEYGKRNRLQLGSTVSAMLTVDSYYYIIHVGDCRIYQVTDSLRQLTRDHTLVAQDVEAGRIRPEDAEADDRRNVLLQCIGASGVIEPQFLKGRTAENAVYFICSDGFRHELAEQELLNAMRPEAMTDPERMGEVCGQLANTAMARGEQDNVTVLAVRTFGEGS